MVSEPYVQLAFAGHDGRLQFTVHDFVHCVAAVDPAGDVYPELQPVHALPFLKKFALQLNDANGHVPLALQVLNVVHPSFVQYCVPVYFLVVSYVQVAFAGQLLVALPEQLTVHDFEQSLTESLPAGDVVPLAQVPLIPVFDFAPVYGMLKEPPAHQLFAGQVDVHAVAPAAIYLPAEQETVILSGSHAVPAEFL